MLGWLCEGEVDGSAVGVGDGRGFMRQKDGIGGGPEGRTRNRDAKLDGKDELVEPRALVEPARYFELFA